jgi:Uma2 family endonuclease
MRFMAYPAFDYISPQDYLEMEVRSNERHEYFDGRIYAMSGASYNHNYIVSNLVKKISSLLDDKDCDFFVSDQRVASPLMDSFVYPDITILCDQIESKENGFDTLTNPSVIIEVMSPSTKGYDMAFKYHYYKQIQSLKEYVLIDSTQIYTQINSRNGDQWSSVINEDTNGSLCIKTIGLEMSFKDIYRKVSFINEAK